MKEEIIFWAVIIVIIVTAMLLLGGCHQPRAKETILESDLSEKSKAWFMVLSESDKQFSLLILIGVIGGAAAVYFKDAKLLGIPLFCAAGCFFLKFLITAGDILAYVCLVGVILLLVFYSARYWRVAEEFVRGGVRMKADCSEEAYHDFKVAQEFVQSKPTEKIVREIKSKL